MPGMAGILTMGFRESRRADFCIVAPAARFKRAVGERDPAGADSCRRS
jgi:hypothetical protein